MKTAVSISLVLFLLACGKDDEPRTELETYTDKFFEEAAARYVKLDRSNLTVKFVDLSEVLPGYAKGSVDPPVVKISNQIWANIGPVKKEILMFHELGHAVLGRSHFDGKLPNCIDYRSLMIGVDQFAYFHDDDLFLQRRKYYVDELFNIDTKFPSWGGDIPSNKTSIDLTSIEPEFITTNETNFDAPVFPSDDEEWLQIICLRASGGDGYWQIVVPGDSIPPSGTIKVTFDVWTTGVISPGAYVSVGAQGQWAFQDIRYYKGDLNFWQTHEITLNCYPSSKPDLIIKLGLSGNGTQSVFFNKVKVDSYN